MEQNTEFLLKNKHTIELLLLNNGKFYDDCLKYQSIFDNKTFLGNHCLQSRFLMSLSGYKVAKITLPSKRKNAWFCM